MPHENMNILKKARSSLKYGESTGQSGEGTKLEWFRSFVKRQSKNNNRYPQFHHRWGEMCLLMNRVKDERAESSKGRECVSHRRTSGNDSVYWLRPWISGSRVSD